MMLYTSILTLLIMFYVKSTKINTFNFIKSDSSVYETEILQIFQNKQLTQKLSEISNLKMTLNKMGSFYDGLLFQADGTNISVASSNFEKIANINGNSIVVKFTNIDKCNINQKDKTNILLIDFIDKDNNILYASIKFPVKFNIDVLNLSANFKKQCVRFIEEKKNRFTSFESELKMYWKTKHKLKLDSDHLKKLEDDQGKDREEFRTVEKQKSEIDKIIDENKNNVDTNSKKIEEVKKSLKNNYKDSNDKQNLLNKDENEINSIIKEIEKLSGIKTETEAKSNKLIGEGNLLGKESERLNKEISELNNMLNLKNSELQKNETICSEYKKQSSQLQNEINSNTNLVSTFNKEINVNKDTIEKIKTENIPNQMNKTQLIIADLKNQFENITQEIKDLDKETVVLNLTLSDTNNRVSGILDNKEQIHKVNKEKILKNIEKMKVIYDDMVKTYKILPEVYVRYMWEFMQLNSVESLNYLKAIKPSFFSLYSYTWYHNNPKRISRMIKRMKI